MAELPQSRINERNITSEMRESFLDYAMSAVSYTHLTLPTNREV